MNDYADLHPAHGAPQRRSAAGGGSLRPRYRPIMAFRGFCNGAVAHVQGHVGFATPGNPALRPGLRHHAGAHEVVLHNSGGRHVATLDEAGYYAAAMDQATPPDADGRAEAIVVADLGYGSVTANHEIFVAPGESRRLLVWDVDDTLVAAPRRRPGAGAASAASAAPDPAAVCDPVLASAGDVPVFVVSTRSWPDYGALLYSAALQALPAAPLLLHPAPRLAPRDDPLLSKAQHLRLLLASFPDAELLLVTHPRTAARDEIARLLDEHAGRVETRYPS
jgi:phosphatidate phosphatase APP1